MATDTPGTQRTWPWWAESHETVLSQVRATEWPSRLLDIEDLAGRLAGDEFYARVAAPGPGSGLNPKGWRRSLLEKAGDAMAADLANEGSDGNDWPKLWAFRCGLADDEDAEELAAEAAEFSDRGITPVPIPWYQPTNGSGTLVARDAYGARFLLTAAFSDPARPAVADHWYAWDLDWCSAGMVVGAGVYDTAEAALAHWRTGVGPAAATAGLAPCPPELGARLLDVALDGVLQSVSVFGDEPAEFFREFPRLFRRAAALAHFIDRLLPRQRPGATAEDREAALEAFLGWHAGNAWNSPGDRDAAEEALETILAEWGPDAPPDEDAFYACSAHRIETSTSILRDTYEPDEVNRALALLPHWVQWCARRSGLDGQFADRALEVARAEAAVPASENQGIAHRDIRFRQPE